MLFPGWPYFTILEASKKQSTLGKRLLGLQVTDVDWERIGFVRANARYWSKVLSWLPLFAGFIMIAFSARKLLLGLAGDQRREDAQHRQQAETSLRGFQSELTTNRKAVGDVRDYHVSETYFNDIVIMEPKLLGMYDQALQLIDRELEP